MTLTDRLSNVAARLRDALVYDAENTISLRGTIADLFVEVRDLAARSYHAEAPAQVEVARTPQPTKRFALDIPSDDAASKRRLYFIDGLITESGIRAIKEIRTIDDSPLREAKDLYDRLPVLTLKAYGDVRT